MGREFQYEHENVDFTVRVTEHSVYDGDGYYGRPLAGFISGQSDMANAAVPISVGETAIGEAHGVEYVELPVAMAPIAIVTDRGNEPVQCMTIDQLRAYWKKDSIITSWNGLDPTWPDQPIVPYRHSESGVISAFARALFGHDLDLRGTDDVYAAGGRVTSAIRQESGALGYAGYGSFLSERGELKRLQVDAGNGCVSPIKDAIAEEAYPLVIGPLYLYVNKSSLERPEVRAFAEFYMHHAFWLSPRAGYVALTTDQYRENLALIKGCTTPEMRERDRNILDELGLPDCSEPLPTFPLPQMPT